MEGRREGRRVIGRVEGTDLDMAIENLDAPVAEEVYLGPLAVVFEFTSKRLGTVFLHELRNTA